MLDIIISNRKIQMKRKAVLLILVLLLVLMADVECQKGKGKKKNNNSGSSYESCRRSCQSRRDYSQSCVDNCVSSGSGGGGSMAMFFLILCCGIPILCFLCCAMCTGALKNAEHHSRRGSSRNSAHSHPDDQVSDATYLQLVQKHNYPASPALSRDNFQAATNMFLQLMSKSYTDKNFKIITNEGEFYAKARATFQEDTPSQPYAKNFTMSGEDMVGDYTCKGAVVCNEGGMFVWFMKEYLDRDDAGQTDEWSDLIYESTYFQPDRIEGKWYYGGFEFSPEHSGTWILSNHGGNYAPREMDTIGQKIVMGDNDLTRPLNQGNNW